MPRPPLKWATEETHGCGDAQGELQAGPVRDARSHADQHCAPVSVRNPSDDSMPASTELNGKVPTSST